ncbi:hypothetical protein [Nitrospirillum bahiense]|nr:hypothetical protein [Nitrospirillum amazonense]
MVTGWYGAVAVMLGGLLSGCVPARQMVDSDLHRAGGISGAMMDDHLLPMPSKNAQVYRAAIAMALIAAAGEQTISNANDADDYVWALGRVTHQLVEMRNIASVNKDCAAMAKLCTVYAAEFEAQVPALEGRIYKLALSVIPREKFGDVADDLIGQNYLRLALDVAKTAGDLALAGHRMAATYRSALEGIAYAVQKERRAEPFKNMEEVTAEIHRVLKTPDLSFEPQLQDFDLIFHLALRSCRQVAGRSSDTGRMLKKCDEDVKMPALIPTAS